MDELLKALREGTVKSGDTRQIDLVNELGRQIKTLQQQADTMPVRVLEESCEAMLPYGCSIHIQEMQVRDADTVHHIYPAEEYPEYEWMDWNLISVSRATHNRLENRKTGELTKEGRMLQRLIRPMEDWRKGHG